MTGTLRPNRSARPTSKQPPMRYIRYTTDVPEASAKLVDLGTQPVVLNVRTCRNEYFLLAHIYARHGIPTHGLLTLSAIAAQPFPSFQ